MPSAALHRCPRCRELTPSPCPRCTPARTQEYSRRRGTRQERGYDHVWTRWRAGVIERHALAFCGDRPPSAPLTNDSLCRLAGLEFIDGRDLDHIVPIVGLHDPRRLDESNVQLLCFRCHEVKRQRETQTAGGTGFV